MRALFLFLLSIAWIPAISQGFHLDRIRSPFDRSLHDYRVSSSAGDPLFYLKAEQYTRIQPAPGGVAGETIRYYRIIFPQTRYEAEIPYVSRRMIKRFIREQQLVRDGQLDMTAVNVVVRLYPDFFSRERLMALRR